MTINIPTVNEIKSLWNPHRMEIDEKHLDFLIDESKGNNSEEAKLLLGLIYETGNTFMKVGFHTRRIAKDLHKAEKLYSELSDLNNPEGQFRLAMMMISGHGANDDYQQAFLLLWRASKQNHSKAQFQLAKFYISDWLFPRDCYSAFLCCYMAKTADPSNDILELYDKLKDLLTPKKVSFLLSRITRYNTFLDLVGKCENSKLVAPVLYLRLHAYMNPFECRKLAWCKNKSVFIKTTSQLKCSVCNATGKVNNTDCSTIVKRPTSSKIEMRDASNNRSLTPLMENIMEFPKRKIESCFRGALSGTSSDIFKLICAYLEDKDNPDSIDRAYNIAKQLNHKECSGLLDRFHLGYYGRKYLNYAQHHDSKHASPDVLHNTQSSLRGKTDKHWDNYLKACQAYHMHNKDDTLDHARLVTAPDLLHAACYLRGYTYEEVHTGRDYSKQYIIDAYNEYKRAAKYGSLPGMKAIVRLSRNPNIHNYLDQECLDYDYFKYSKMAADRGDTESMLIVGTCYKYAIGTMKDDRQALLWLYKAVLLGCEYATDSIVTQMELADLLIDNTLFEPRYGEAYSWLQSYNLQYPLFIRENERKELTEAIIAHLSPKYKGLPNKLAEVYRKRFDSCGMIVPFMAQDLDSYLDYLLDKFAEGDTLFDATVEIAKFLLPTTSKRVESNVDNDDRFNDTSPATETIASNNIVYSFINLVASNFQINKVKLELEIGRKLDKNEELDYTKIIITYDGKYKDTKEARIYEPMKVNKKARQLLLCLACQNSVKDKEKRAGNVASIISEHKEEPSRLNAMFRSMFHNCGLPNKSCMINKDRGTIQVCLSIKDPTNKIDSERCNMCQYSPYKC